MTSFVLQRSKGHRERYREIAGAFIHYGFDYLLPYFGSEWQLPGRSVPTGAQGNEALTEHDLAVHLRQALEELGPTFVKLGQALSTRPDLPPPPCIAELSMLQDMVSPEPWDAIREVITQELGRAPEDVFATIDPQPMATASLAQVHAATLPNGEEGVVKVQRPNIVPTISTDLDILQELAAAAQSSPLPSKHDYVAVAADFVSSLRNELDCRREGRNATASGRTSLMSHACTYRACMANKRLRACW